MRGIAYSLAAVMLFVIASATACCLYSSVVSRKSLQEFRLSVNDTNGRSTISIDGRLLGGMISVHSVRSYQKDRCIVLVVRAGITRPGVRGATFHYDIPVPSDVDQVSFGNTNDVIWMRKY